MKHVNDEFWQKFGPEVLEYAREQGKSEFFMFGEVFDTTKWFTSTYTTRNRMQSILDFPFQAAAQDFAANSGAAERLADFFADDDWYTDADSNAYQLPTFLGNHDMGRIGRFVQVANPGATDAELLARDRLAHELMYLSRGNPVIYYGDEQGFTGDGGDQLARQDMFPSRVAEYNDDDLIGTDATTAESNFDRAHPLYRASRGWRADARAPGPARRRSPAPLRERRSRRLRLLAHRRRSSASTSSRSTTPRRRRRASIPTYGRGRRFARVYGEGPATAPQRRRRRLRVTVAPLSAVVYESSGRIPRERGAPSVFLAAPSPSAEARSRMEVHADVDGDSFYEVTFQARVADGEWHSIGTDDNAPYRVYHDVSRRTTPARSSSTARSCSTTRAHAHEPRAQHRGAGAAHHAPAPGGRRARARPRPAAGQRRPRAGVAVGDLPAAHRHGPWTEVGTDTSSPDYTVVDDISGLGLAEGAQIRYRAVLTEADGNEVLTRGPHGDGRRTAGHHGDRPLPPAGRRLHRLGPAPVRGDAVAPSVLANVSWGNPWPYARSTTSARASRSRCSDDTTPLNYIIHQPSRDDVPAGREPGGDRSFTPSTSPEVWIVQGDPTIHTTRPPGT